MTYAREALFGILILGTILLVPLYSSAQQSDTANQTCKEWWAANKDKPSAMVTPPKCQQAVSCSGTAGFASGRCVQDQCKADSACGKPLEGLPDGEPGSGGSSGLGENELPPINVDQGPSGLSDGILDEPPAPSESSSFSQDPTKPSNSFTPTQNQSNDPNTFGGKPFETLKTIANKITSFPGSLMPDNFSQVGPLSNFQPAGSLFDPGSWNSFSQTPTPYSNAPVNMASVRPAPLTTGFNSAPIFDPGSVSPVGGTANPIGAQASPFPWQSAPTTAASPFSLAGTPQADWGAVWESLTSVPTNISNTVQGAFSEAMNAFGLSDSSSLGTNDLPLAPDGTVLDSGTNSGILDNFTGNPATDGSPALMGDASNEALQRIIENPDGAWTGQDFANARAAAQQNFEAAQQSYDAQLEASPFAQLMDRFGLYADPELTAARLQFSEINQAESLARLREGQVVMASGGEQPTSSIPPILDSQSPANRPITRVQNELTEAMGNAEKARQTYADSVAQAEKVAREAGMIEGNKLSPNGGISGKEWFSPEEAAKVAEVNRLETARTSALEKSYQSYDPQRRSLDAYSDAYESWKEGVVKAGGTVETRNLNQNGAIVDREVPVFASRDAALADLERRVQDVNAIPASNRRNAAADILQKDINTFNAEGAKISETLAPYEKRLNDAGQTLSSEFQKVSINDEVRRLTGQLNQGVGELRTIQQRLQPAFEQFANANRQLEGYNSAIGNVQALESELDTRFSTPAQRAADTAYLMEKAADTRTREAQQLLNSYNEKALTAKAKFNGLYDYITGEPSMVVNDGGVEKSLSQLQSEVGQQLDSIRGEAAKYQELADFYKSGSPAAEAASKLAFAESRESQFRADLIADKVAYLQEPDTAFNRAMEAIGMRPSKASLEADITRLAEGSLNPAEANQYRLSDPANRTAADMLGDNLARYYAERDPYGLARPVTRLVNAVSPNLTIAEQRAALSQTAVRQMAGRAGDIALSTVELGLMTPAGTRLLAPIVDPLVRPVTRAITAVGEGFSVAGARFAETRVGAWLTTDVVEQNARLVQISDAIADGSIRSAANPLPLRTNYAPSAVNAPRVVSEYASPLGRTTRFDSANNIITATTPDAPPVFTPTAVTSVPAGYQSGISRFAQSTVGKYIQGAALASNISIAAATDAAAMRSVGAAVGDAFSGVGARVEQVLSAAPRSAVPGLRMTTGEAITRFNTSRIGAASENAASMLRAIPSRTQALAEIATQRSVLPVLPAEASLSAPIRVADLVAPTISTAVVPAVDGFAAASIVDASISGNPLISATPFEFAAKFSAEAAVNAPAWVQNMSAGPMKTLLTLALAPSPTAPVLVGAMDSIVTPASGAGITRVGLDVDTAAQRYATPQRTIATTYGYPGDPYNPDGAPTSSGAPVSQDLYSAAHRELPLGTVIKVTNVSGGAGNGKQIIAVVNNRGTLRNDALLDLTPAASRAIANNPSDRIGTISTPVEYEVLFVPSQAVASNYLNNAAERAAFPEMAGVTAEQSQTILQSVNQIAGLTIASGQGKYLSPSATTETPQVADAGAPPAAQQPATVQPASLQTQPTTAIVKTETLKLANAPLAGGETRVYIPEGFNPSNAKIYVYYHGQGGGITDAIDRQRIVEQFAGAGIKNGVLVIPALRSNVGSSGTATRFGDPQIAEAYFAELGTSLNQLAGATSFADAPIVQIAYSGGFDPASEVLASAKLAGRIEGTILLDAGYAADTFAAWAKANPSKFLVSAYTNSTASGNSNLKDLLGNKVQSTLPQAIGPGTQSVFRSNGNHANFVQNAWAQNPLQDILGRTLTQPTGPVVADSATPSAPVADIVLNEALTGALVAPQSRPALLIAALERLASPFGANAQGRIPAEALTEFQQSAFAPQLSTSEGVLALETVQSIPNLPESVRAAATRVEPTGQGLRIYDANNAALGDVVPVTSAAPATEAEARELLPALEQAVTSGVRLPFVVLDPGNPTYEIVVWPQKTWEVQKALTAAGLPSLTPVYTRHYAFERYPNKDGSINYNQRHQEAWEKILSAATPLDDGSGAWVFNDDAKIPDLMRTIKDAEGGSQKLHPNQNYLDGNNVKVLVLGAALRGEKDIGYILAATEYGHATHGNGTDTDFAIGPTALAKDYAWRVANVDNPTGGNALAAQYASFLIAQKLLNQSVSTWGGFYPSASGHLGAGKSNNSTWDFGNPFMDFKDPFGIFTGKKAPRNNLAAIERYFTGSGNRMTFDTYIKFRDSSVYARAQDGATQYAFTAADTKATQVFAMKSLPDSTVLLTADDRPAIAVASDLLQEAPPAQDLRSRIAGMILPASIPLAPVQVAENIPTASPQFTEPNTVSSGSEIVAQAPGQSIQNVADGTPVSQSAADALPALGVEEIAQGRPSLAEIEAAEQMLAGLQSSPFEFVLLNAEEQNAVRVASWEVDEPAAPSPPPSSPSPTESQRQVVVKAVSGLNAAKQSITDDFTAFAKVVQGLNAAKAEKNLVKAAAIAPQGVRVIQDLENHVKALAENPLVSAADRATLIKNAADARVKSIELRNRIVAFNNAGFFAKMSGLDAFIQNTAASRTSLKEAIAKIAAVYPVAGEAQNLSAVEMDTLTVSVSPDIAVLAEATPAFDPFTTQASLDAITQADAAFEVLAAAPISPFQAVMPDAPSIAFVEPVSDAIGAVPPEEIAVRDGEETDVAGPQIGQDPNTELLVPVGIAVVTTPFAKQIRDFFSRLSRATRNVAGGAVGTARDRLARGGSSNPSSGGSSGPVVPAQAPVRVAGGTVPPVSGAGGTGSAPELTTTGGPMAGESAPSIWRRPLAMWTGLIGGLGGVIGLLSVGPPSQWGEEPVVPQEDPQSPSQQPTTPTSQETPPRTTRGIGPGSQQPQQPTEQPSQPEKPAESTQTPPSEEQKPSGEQKPPESQTPPSKPSEQTEAPPKPESETPTQQPNDGSVVTSVPPSETETKPGDTGTKPPATPPSTETAPDTTSPDTRTPDGGNSPGRGGGNDIFGGGNPFFGGGSGGLGGSGIGGSGFMGGGMSLLSGLFQALAQWFTGGGEEENETPRTPPPQATTTPTVIVGTIVGNPSLIDPEQTTTLSWSTVGVDMGSTTCAVVTADFTVIKRGPANGSMQSPALSESTRFGIICNTKNATDKLLNETLIRVRGDNSDPERIFTPEQVSASQSTGASNARNNSSTAGSSDGQSGNPTPEDIFTCEPEQAMDSFIRCLCEAEPNPAGCSIPPGGLR